jgi:hypothetical protein
MSRVRRKGVEDEGAQTPSASRGAGVTCITGCARRRHATCPTTPPRGRHVPRLAKQHQCKSGAGRPIRTTAMPHARAAQAPVTGYSARSVDLRGLWRSKRVGLGYARVARIRSRARCLRSRIPCWRACRTRDPAGIGVLLGLTRPLGLPAGPFPMVVAVELRGVEPLTPCMPWTVYAACMAAG